MYTIWVIHTKSAIIESIYFSALTSMGIKWQMLLSDCHKIGTLILAFLTLIADILDFGLSHFCEGHPSQFVI